MSRVIALIEDPAIASPVLIVARSVATALDASLESVRIERDVDQAGSRLDTGGAPVRTVSGDPIEVLPGIVADEDVVAVVVATGGAYNVSRPGAHLAMTLAGRTDKPVVVVPPGCHPPEFLHTVVVAMEGTPGKARALQRSIALSARAGLEIVVVHVEDEDSIPSFSDQVQHETEAYAQEFFARHLIGATQMRLELRVGVPGVEVLKAIESTHADLVAIGWPQTDDPTRGAVARQILDGSPVPVLLVAVV